MTQTNEENKRELNKLYWELEILGNPETESLILYKLEVLSKISKLKEVLK